MSGASSANPLGQLADEFLQRHRRGERPALTEYTARHPELAEQIRELFPGLAMLEDVRPAPHAAAGTPPEAAFPRRLGEYRIVREVGRGGMGIVYEAEQESLGRRVALKVLPRGAAAHPEQVERFRREARAAARLHHTNIVPVFGVGEQDGTHFYVMQYIEGRPLDEILEELRRLRDQAAASPRSVDSAPAAQEGKGSSADVARSLWHGRFHAGRQGPPEAGDPGSPTRVDDAAVSRGGPACDVVTRAPGAPGSSGPLSDPHRPFAKSVAQLGAQVAGALEYAAAQGVLHRDVKPSNLLLDVWGSVWLTDFGLAKATGAPDLTRPGGLFGTLRYLAPERFQGRADVRSDVYALGLTLYEMLALKPAFGGHDEAELTRLITTGDTTPLDRVNPNLPRDLVTIIHKAMATDPADRYQTAGALAEDLRRFLDNRSILARRVSLPEQAWRWCRRNPTLAALLTAVSALVVLAAGSALWFDRQQAERRGRAREALKGALDRARELRGQGCWRESLAVLEQGKGRLEDAAPDDLHRHLAQIEAEVALALRLETIRLQRAGVGGIIDHEAAAAKYAAAFREAGLTTPGGEHEAAARIQGSSIRNQLIAGLDDWAVDEFVAEHRPDPTAWRRVVRLARLADPDPTWRDSFRNPSAWRNRRALERLAESAPVDRLSPPLVAALGNLLRVKGAETEPVLRKAHHLHPDDFWLNFDLGFALAAKGENGKAVGYFRAALTIQPRSSKVYRHLGLALHSDGQPMEAVDAFRRAIEIDPGSAEIHIELGTALAASGRNGEATAAFRRALQIQPRSVRAQVERGGTLLADGRYDEAASAFRRAAEIVRPTADAYGELAESLAAKGRMPMALTAFRRAVELGCKDPATLTNFGEALRATGQLEEALAVYRRAIDLDPPNGSVAYCNIGHAWRGKGQPERAVVAYRSAVKLDPKLGEAYCGLGQALHARGHIATAMEAFDRALALDPRLAEGNLALGEALLQQGRYAEARAAIQRGCGLLNRGDRTRATARQPLELLEQLPALDAKLTAVLEDKDRPGAAEQRDLARLCQIRHRRYAAATRLYAAAFAAEPNLGDDLKTLDRYAAARAAAMAAFGQDSDEGKLDERAKARLRKQALEWLLADLAAWAELVGKTPRDSEEVQWTLWQWKGDGDLAGVREAEWLSQLPADERQSWQGFWSRVDGLLQRVERRNRSERR
jgi:serine/threonine protein kinase/Tfp pilus assembly protein PilF